VTSRLPVGTSKASHHAGAGADVPTSHLRKSQSPRSDRHVPLPSPNRCANNGGRGRQAGLGEGVKGDTDSQQCGMHRNTTKNSWQLLLLDVKVV
jgi:hypothetical protein